MLLSLYGSFSHVLDFAIRRHRLSNSPPPPRFTLLESFIPFWKMHEMLIYHNMCRDLRLRRTLMYRQISHLCLWPQKLTCSYDILAGRNKDSLQVYMWKHMPYLIVRGHKSIKICGRWLCSSLSFCKFTSIWTQKSNIPSSVVVTPIKSSVLSVW